MARGRPRKKKGFLSGIFSSNQESKAIVHAEKKAIEKQNTQLSAQDIQVLKNTIAKDLTDSELNLYFYECKRRKTHPMSRLIHPVKRKGQLTFQVSIDYLRARAESSNQYRGQDPVKYEINSDGKVISATVVVYRANMDKGIPATAFMEEYEVKGDQGFMWRKMPKTMIAKCAEALAFRKAFPEHLAGLYTHDEMAQAGIPSNGTGVSQKAIEAPKYTVEETGPYASTGQAKPPNKPIEGTVVEPKKPREVSRDAGLGKNTQQTAPPKPPTNPEDKISDSQRKRMYAIQMRESCRTPGEVSKKLKDMGYSSSKDILKKDYNDIIDWLQIISPDDAMTMGDEILKYVKKAGVKESALVEMGTGGSRKKLVDCNETEILHVYKKMKEWEKVGK
jgi:phage recombination protein Bet